MFAYMFSLLLLPKHGLSVMSRPSGFIPSTFVRSGNKPFTHHARLEYKKRINGASKRTISLAASQIALEKAANEARGLALDGIGAAKFWSSWTSLRSC